MFYIDKARASFEQARAQPLHFMRGKAECGMAFYDKVWGRRVFVLYIPNERNHNVRISSEGARRGIGELKELSQYWSVVLQRKIYMFRARACSLSPFLLVSCVVWYCKQETRPPIRYRQMKAETLYVATVICDLQLRNLEAIVNEAEHVRRVSHNLSAEIYMNYRD